LKAEYTAESSIRSQKLKQTKQCPFNSVQVKIHEVSPYQEKGSKNLLAEFPNKAFELITTVFIAVETCVFSVSSKT